MKNTYGVKIVWESGNDMWSSVKQCLDAALNDFERCKTNKAIAEVELVRFVTTTETVKTWKRKE